MKDITKITRLLLGLVLSVPLVAQETYYMDPEGGDSNPEASDKPFTTLVEIQEVVVTGDVIYINPGTCVVPADQAPMTTTNSGLYHCILHMSKNGEAGKPISYLANPNKQGRLIPDLSQVKPKDQRTTVFYITGPNLYLKGFDVTGTQVTITDHTQSECFRIVKGANNNKFEDLRTHDSMIIGFYSPGGGNNHILNCDAYNNYDSVSEGGKGGNVDGFGDHVNSSSIGEGKGTGSALEGCRARYNSDDGFDLTNCFEAAKVTNCWPFLNGYKLGTKEVADDDTGLKTGGYGMVADKLPAIPSVVPQHEVRNSLAYYNRLRGFYVSHHLDGIIFESNTAVNDGENYNMVDHKPLLVLPPTGVNGHDHIVKNNLPLVTRSDSKHIIMVNKAKNEVSNNSFGDSEEVIETNFISLEETELMRDRKPNGDLPGANLEKLTIDAELRFWGMGCLATDKPIGLDFGWLKKPTIVVVGSRASIVGPGAAPFTGMYAIIDDEETTEFDKNPIDLSDFGDVLEVKVVIEDADGNATKSIALKFKR